MISPRLLAYCPLRGCTIFGTLPSSNSDEATARRLLSIASGREPVREWLKALGPEDRKVIGEDIKVVEFSWPIGMPLCRPLGKGLWEVRSDITDGRIARVLFCVAEGKVCTPSLRRRRRRRHADADLATRRRKELI